MSAPHLPEGVLVALLDDEMNPPTARAARDHLTSCAECATRLDALRRADRRVRDWLIAHDPAAPPPHAYGLGVANGVRSENAPGPSRKLGLRWAAAASLVLAIAVAAGPARAWILDRIGFGGDAVPAEGAGPPPLSGSATAGTSFAPTSPEVRIDLSDIGGARELTLIVHDGPRVRLLVPEGDVEVLVRPDGIEVHDPVRSHQRYRLEVPRSVLRVRLVRPGPAGDTVLAAPGAGGTVVLVQPHPR